MVIAKKFIIAKYFDGEPKASDLKLIEEKLPPIKDGEILLEAEFLSVDPYMRVYSQKLPIGSLMPGGQVTKIIESKNPDFPVGERVRGYYGWSTHTIINPNKWNEGSTMLSEKPKILQSFGDLSPSLALGVFGMPGDTAYFGLLEICKPKAGETLVVSGAAGAVGSHVGQIGKIKGMKVIGIAGYDEKCKWLVNELGFDYVINYKTENLEEDLKKAAPNGIDCYFDNVGGEISSTVIYQMNPFGRISVCGSISAYNSDTSKVPRATILQPVIVFNQLKMEGFIVSRWKDRYDESFSANLEWIRQGKLKYRETITVGFENMLQALIDLFHGKNTGKAIVKA